MLVVSAFEAMEAAARALDKWAPDDQNRPEARMVWTGAAQMHIAARAAYQIQMDDRLAVPDWVKDYLP